MAVIRPFRAIRPAQGLAEQTAALPYDVYNRQEAKEAVKDAPLSFLRIDRAETCFDDSVDTYDARVYEKARELLAEQIQDGVYVTEEKPCYYLYELVMDGRSQTGIVGCASIDDYERGVIKKHENTRADKEEDRIRHVDALNAQTGPIFLAYRDRDDLREVVLRQKRMRHSMISPQRTASPTECTGWRGMRIPGASGNFSETWSRSILRTDITAAPPP